VRVARLTEVQLATAAESIPSNHHLVFFHCIITDCLLQPLQDAM
jgi:hypothetical protein